jgi:hypothetical protein
MNNLCKCKHPVKDHRDTAHGLQKIVKTCWHISRFIYGQPVCSCIDFKAMANLEYLEYEYQKTL